MENNNNYNLPKRKIQLNALDIKPQKIINY